MFSYFLHDFLVFVRLCLVTFFVGFWVSGVCSFMFSYFLHDFLVFVRLCLVTFFVGFWCLFVYV